MMNAPARTASSIATDLREERAAMQSFLELLQEEQESLLQGNMDAVGEHVSRKSAWLQKLAGFADRRRKLLQSRHLSTDRHGMEDWLSRQSGHTELTTEWNELLDMTRKARHANETNGLLIATRLQSNQLALNALAAAARSDNLYGKDGQSIGAWQSRPLGSV